jgi:magnesium-transporting ATPase (P-type)
VIPKKSRHPAIKIIQRHHFSSSLKRMSVVACYTQAMESDVTYIATVKGAPETLKPMVRKGLSLLSYICSSVRDRAATTGFWQASGLFSCFYYCKVASIRPVCYSILELFGQRSQYVSIKFPLHKPSENALLTATSYCTARDFTETDILF